METKQRRIRWMIGCLVAAGLVGAGMWMKVIPLPTWEIVLIIAGLVGTALVLIITIDLKGGGDGPISLMR